MRNFMKINLFGKFGLFHVVSSLHQPQTHISNQTGFEYVLVFCVKTHKNEEKNMYN